MVLIIARNIFRWKLKVPIKINIFCGFLFRGVILTKDNLAKKNWNGFQRCFFLCIMRLFNIFSLNAILQNFSSE